MTYSERSSFGLVNSPQETAAADRADQNCVHVPTILYTSFWPYPGPKGVTIACRRSRSGRRRCWHRCGERAGQIEGDAVGLAILTAQGEATALDLCSKVGVDA